MGMGNLQRMAQQMQQEMLRIQTELEATTVDGSAGGGVVSATVTGKQELVSITIDPSAVDPEDVDWGHSGRLKWQRSPSRPALHRRPGLGPVGAEDRSPANPRTRP